MSSPSDDNLDAIEVGLRRRRLKVERVQDSFNVSQGTGIMAHKAHVDPRPLIDILPEDRDQRRRQIAGYTSGVKHVLLEPSRSSADEWGFVDSAGRLLPTLQVSTFGYGVEAAADESAWTIDFVDDLQFAYLIHLDRGIRVLTDPQVQRWEVSDDRITAAGRSLLFHKTRNLDFQPVESFDAVYRLSAGDGHDAARCLVVADAFFTELGDGFRFSLPSPDHLFCTHGDSPEERQQLIEATKSTYDDVDDPLTTRLFRYEAGTPIPLDISHD